MIRKDISSDRINMPNKEISLQFCGVDLMSMVSQQCKDGNTKSECRWCLVNSLTSSRKCCYQQKISKMEYAFVKFTNNTSKVKFFSSFHEYFEGDMGNKKIIEITLAKLQPTRTFKLRSPLSIWCNRVTLCQTHEVEVHARCLVSSSYLLPDSSNWDPHLKPNTIKLPPTRCFKPSSMLNV